MNSRRTALLIALTVTCVSFSAAPAEAGGWLVRATGGRLRTPEPIRKIAPKISVSMPQNDSHLMVSTPPYIDAHGRVYSGTGHSGQRPTYRGMAQVRRTGNKEYWVSRYSDIHGKPKPRFRRYVPQPQPQYRPAPQYGGYSTQQYNVQKPQMTQQQRMMQMQQQQMMQRHQVENRMIQNLSNSINQSFRNR